MAIDPATGMNIPSPADEFRNRRPVNDLPLDRPANDEIVELPPVEDRSAAAWLLPAVVAVVLLTGIVYYFFGPFFATVG